MSYEPYHLPPSLQEQASSTGLNELADTLLTEYGTPYEFEGLITDETALIKNLETFRDSKIYRSLSDNDKATYRENTRIDTSNASWSVLSSENEPNTLFEVPKIIGRTACGLRDVFVLSGAGAYSFEDYDFKRFNAVLDQYKKFGFASKHGLLVLSSAVLANKSVNPGAEQYTTSNFSVKTADGTETTSIFGDTHGDFRMSKLTISNFTAVTSWGEETEIIPTLEKMVSAYHSTEPEIVTGICAYLIDTHPNLEKLKEIFAEIASQIQPTGKNSGSGLYGDYGETTPFHTRHELRQSLFDNEHSSYLSELPVSPNSSFILLLKNVNGALVFQNFYVEGPKIMPQSDTLEYDVSSAVELIKAFCKIGGANLRTNESQVLSIVKEVNEIIDESVKQQISVQEYLNQT